MTVLDYSPELSVTKRMTKATDKLPNLSTVSVAFAHSDIKLSNFEKRRIRQYRQKRDDIQNSLCTLRKTKNPNYERKSQLEMLENYCKKRIAEIEAGVLR